MYFSSLSVVLVAVALIALLLMNAVQYIGLRVRNATVTQSDPQLGRKFALHLFLNLAILLVLVGLTISVRDLIGVALSASAPPPPAAVYLPANGLNPGGRPTPPLPSPPLRPAPGSFDPFNPAQRLALALVVSGTLHGLLAFLFLLRGTNDREYPQVRRAFALSRLLASGLVMMASTTVTFAMLFQAVGNPSFEVIDTLLAAVFVWGPTALAHAAVMLVRTRRETQAQRLEQQEGRDREQEMARRRELQARENGE